MIDRIAPTRRPEGPPRGYQSWRDLLFVHWEVPEEKVRALVPAGLQLDPWEGKHLVGMVPFGMENVRPRWAPALPGIRTFLETNVRLYVHRDGVPGVFFLSLDAANAPAVLGARVGWSLPYFLASMKLEKAGDRIHYTSKRLLGPDATVDVTYRVGESVGSGQPGTLEHFLCERYVLFCERGGTLVSGNVHHVPYPLHAVTVEHLSQTITAAAGLPAAGPPFSVLYSPGVDVEVFSLA